MTKHFRTMAGIFVALAAAGAAIACGDDDVDVVDDTGTVEFNWTIDGSTDPESCDAFGVESFEATFIDEGFVVREFEVPCEDFSARVDVFVDDYIVWMTLVDTQGFAVTERVVEEEITVLEGEVDVLDASFPADTFNGVVDGGAGGSGGAGGDGGVAGSGGGAGSGGIDYGD